MADFMTAMKWMIEGKKVKRPHWGDGLYWQKKNNIIDNGLDIGKAQTDFTNFEAMDWMMYEDGWNLADTMAHAEMIEGMFATPKMLKTFIQKVKEDIDEVCVGRNSKKLYNSTVRLILDKRVGEL